MTRDPTGSLGDSHGTGDESGTQSTPRRSGRIRRRDFIRISAVSGLALGLGTALTRRLLGSGELQRIEDTRGAMGTYVRLALVAPDGAAARHAISTVFDRIASLEAVLSRYRRDSPVSALNATGSVRRPPAEFVEVLARARQVSELTGGAFDVTVQPLVELVQQTAAHATKPTADAIRATRRRIGFQRVEIASDRIAFTQEGMSITLDGIAKGYVVDAALAVLEREGFPCAMVDAGGDIGATLRPDGSSWRIGVQDPRLATGTTIAVTRLARGAMATSGDYLHAYSADFTTHHILDPELGQSPLELSSVSIIAPSACLADGLSTGVMVLGPRRGLALIDRLPGVEALLVTKAREIMTSRGFPLTS